MLKILAQNTASNIFVFVVRMVVTFVMTPILITNLGNYDYGIWELVAALIGYMGLLDIGIRPAASRFCALHNAQNDREALLKTYSSTLLFMSCIGTIVLIFMTLWATTRPDILAEDQIRHDKYVYFLIIIGVQVFAMFPGQIAESFFEGLQKYVQKNNITLITLIVGSTIIYQLIRPDNALLLLATVNVIGLIVKYLIYFLLLSRQANGRIVFSLNKYSKETLKTIIRFGFKTFLQSIAAKIAHGANSIIIATMLSPAMIVYYVIPANLANYTTTTRMLLTHAFMPFFSDLFAKEQTEQTLKWFLSVSRVVAGLVYPLCIGVILVGPAFIDLWLGEEYTENGRIILYTLCLVAIINATNPLSNRYLTAVNKHGYLAYMYTIDAILLIVLNIAFINLFGFLGIAFGTLLSATIVAPLILRYTCASIEISVFSYLKTAIFPLLLPNMLMILVYFSAIHYLPITSYFELIINSLISAASYIFAFILLSLNAEEKNILQRKVF